MAAFSDEADAGSTSSSAAAVDAFISRCGLPRATTRSACREFILSHFSGVLAEGDVRESPSQGYCSLTYLLVGAGAGAVVQFRPEAHRLDVELAGRARAVYGDLAPRTDLIGRLGLGQEDDDGSSGTTSLLVYFMSLVPGVSLAEFRRRQPGHAKPTAPCGEQVTAQRAALVRDFARLFSRAWENGHPLSALEKLPRPRGLVGNSLRWRLEKMHTELPARFRPVTERVLMKLEDIENLVPWVLTHGDVVPSNIMVDDDAVGDAASQNRSFRLSGMLDWAEAEYLPFGVGLYGLEELLGQTEELWDGTGPYPPRGSRFTHYPEADALRATFWTELEALIPEMRPGAQLRELTELARELGLLLWHGFAFDDGKLDRVVEEGRDGEEVQRLDVFLLGVGAGARSDAARDGQKHVTKTEGDVDLLEEQPTVTTRRRLSLSDAVKRAWTFFRFLRLPGPVFNKV